MTFAIELKEETYFPIQDLRGNICALQKPDGSLAQWTRYTAFGEKTILGDISSVLNPWRFANRREVIDLSLFAHRFYHPRQMRWLTTDPLGFKDGLNLYAYVHNHPFYYKDPDGQFAFAIPLIEVVFEPTVGATLFPAFGAAIACTAIAYGCYQLAVYASNQINEDKAIEAELEEQRSKNKEEDRKKYREDNFPGTDKDLANHSDWKEKTHPNQRKAGHREFENMKTGEKIRFDKGDPEGQGHEAYDHYHRYNPKSNNGRHDQYLDKNSNPVRRGDDKSHLYPPEGVYWEF